MGQRVVRYDEIILHYLREHITKADKLAFISSLLCSLFGYMYFGANIMPNHDGISQLYFDADGSQSFGHGRWAQVIVKSVISSRLHTPWLSLAIFMLVMALSTVIVVRIFQIEHSLAVVGIAASLTLNPSTINMITYFYMIDIFIFALFFGILSIYLTERYKYGVIFAVGFLAISIALHQLFICVAIALFSSRLLQKLLKNKNEDKEIAAFIFKHFILFIGAAGLYSLINKAVLSLLNIPLTDYVTLNRSQLSINYFIEGIRKGYGSIFTHFSITYEVLGTIALIATVSIFILVIVFSLVLLMAKKHITKLQVLLSIAVILVLPILLNPIFIFSSAHAYYRTQFLFVYGLFAVYS
ncbi:MAG: glucosyltransferase domain-containing protein [Lachnospiraceae bacterium]|nr:glucosyltransferase domain-containing protein [Lachnospiraceae bacterium]